MKILKQVSLIVLGLTILSCPGHAMQPPHKELDDNWSKSVKLKDVIGLTQPGEMKNAYTPVVCIVDGLINVRAFSNAQQIDTCSPIGPELKVEDYHGTHVVSTIKEISPKANILSLNFKATGRDGFQPGAAASIAKAAENPVIDIINISLGADILRQPNYMTESCPWYKAILNGARKGKIIVKGLGNDHGKLPLHLEEKLIKNFENLALRILRDPAIKGRFIVVANAQYTQDTETLHSSSNCSSSKKMGVLTAPGTDITARIDYNTYKSCTGTSMATPIVSGVIARLLGEYKKGFELAKITDMGKIRGILADLVLENARKENFFSMSPLVDSFGHGVVNYAKTQQAIERFLQRQSVPQVADQKMDKAPDCKDSQDHKKTVVETGVSHKDDVQVLRDKIQILREKIAEKEKRLDEVGLIMPDHALNALKKEISDLNEEKLIHQNLYKQFFNQ